MKKQSYFPIFFIVALTAFVHVAASKFYLYSDYWWLYIVVHFLGGVCVAASCFWVYYFSGWIKQRVVRPRVFFMITVLSAIAGGLIWEVFEYKTGLTFVLKGIDYTTDTLSDIGTDVVGGLSVYLYQRLVNWRLFTHHE